jgi:hypothetical protein
MADYSDATPPNFELVLLIDIQVRHLFAPV